MGNWDVSKPNNDGERELLDRAVKALEAELATKTCNNKQVSCKLVASEDCISRQAVLDYIYNDLRLGDEEIGNDVERQMELERSYKYVKFLPPVTQKTCNDAISRRAVLEYIEGSEAELGHSSENELVCQYIKELSPVTPKQRTGHWIIISPTDMYCSECNEIEHLDTSRKFCAFCGTKMKGVKEWLKID